jgi:hypothetical protein
MKIYTCLLVAFVFVIQAVKGQTTADYYLPAIQYDENIPTPAEVLGYDIGQWHMTHDQLVMYMRILADASPRVEVREYARSYEARPLLYMIITAEDNHARLDDIQQRHRWLSDPENSNKLEISEEPVVLYQGFSIHGNEASGGNAAPLVAYYLAAGQSAEVRNLLDHAVILLDPCFNPDGFQRFSSWVNMHKNENLTSDNNDREYDEAWPGGRTNHYWFDLNRDWLLVQHPESQGRIKVFHEWKPNILTDHHEMGTNNTFFFMPGIPQRTNPVTPQSNQDLTARIGTFHAKTLDEIGALYYSRESFDDFYYGKGSTYPDANGGIGILFEQASARGHLQKSENGDLSFAYAIRNQFRTALSTQEAGLALREELLAYQQSFYKDALKEASKSASKAYVFGGKDDYSRASLLVELLLQHQVEVYRSAKPLKVNGRSYSAGDSFIVPVSQGQYRLIRGMFETMTTFKDSIFYDVSSWTLPLAYGVPYDELDAGLFSKKLLGSRVSAADVLYTPEKPLRSEYAYLINWNSYFAPRALNRLLKDDLRVKVATKPFSLEGRGFSASTLMVPAIQQGKNPEEIHDLMLELSANDGVEIVGVNTGLTPLGIDLGSPSFEPLKRPKVLLVVGEGVSAYEAGEVWHLLDQRYEVSISKVEFERLSSIALHPYNTIIMVDGEYSGPGGAAAQLRAWIADGGNLIAIKGAAKWARSQSLANLDITNLSTNQRGRKQERLPYGTIREDRGAKQIGGAIVQMEMDLTHPLCYGYTRDTLYALQRGAIAFDAAANPYASPLVYAKDPLKSGYIHEGIRRKLGGSAAAVVSGIGDGKVICLSFNPNFRAFWYGTNHIFANSIFFGPIITQSAVEKAGGRGN